MGNSSNNNDIEFSWTHPYHMKIDSKEYTIPKYTQKRTENTSGVWKATSSDEVRKRPLVDARRADYIIERLREVAPMANYNDTPFFVAFGTMKLHMPFNFPEEFLDMPKIAWHRPSVLKFADCSKEAMGISDLGKINVTFPPWKTKEIRRAYYAAISYVDHEIGRVLKEVKNLGLEENTIIVFWSDHGFHLGENALWAKQTVFDIANRVPFMMKIPGVTENGFKTRNLVELVDIFPTLVEAAGFPSMDLCPRNSHDVALCSEGSSLMPLFEDPNRKDWKDAVFWQYPRGMKMGKIGRNKPWPRLPTQMGYAIRTKRYRYTEWVHIKHLGGLNYTPDWAHPADHEELYDHKIDPQENVNR